MLSNSNKRRGFYGRDVRVVKHCAKRRGRKGGMQGTDILLLIYFFDKHEGGFGMKTFDEVLAEDLQDPAFRRAYEASEKALQGFDEILKARFEAGLTQEDVARRMGTSQAAVARLEGNLAKGRYPSVRSLQRYAKAVGKRLEIRLV